MITAIMTTQTEHKLHWEKLHHDFYCKFVEVNYDLRYFNTSINIPGFVETGRDAFYA